MKNVIPWIIVVILSLYIGWQCTHVPGSRVDMKKVDSLNTAIAKRDSLFSIDSARWIIVTREKDSIIATLTQSKAEQYEAFKNQVVQLTFQRNKFRIAAMVKDTVGQLQACAEFMHLADSFYIKAVLYEATIDSLISASRSQHSDDSTTIKALMADRAAGQLQIAGLQRLLKDAIADNADLRSALAKSKRGRWLLAIITGIGGIFIGHSINN